MVERQLRCDLLRLILVAGWFVPFWRDTDRRWESGGATTRARDQLCSGPRAGGSGGLRGVALLAHFLKNFTSLLLNILINEEEENFLQVFAKRAMKNERDTLKMPPSQCFIVVLSMKRLLFEGPLLVFFCLGQTTTKISNCWLVGWLVGWLID